MSGLNSVVMVGRLTEQPEMKYINDTTKTRFNIAVNRQYRDKQGNSRKETTFVPIVVWGKQAETCAEYLSKGRLVAVDGRLRIDNFETDEGEKRKVVEIIARNVQFLDAAQENTQREKDIDFPEERSMEEKTDIGEETDEETFDKL